MRISVRILSLLLLVLLAVPFSPAQDFNAKNMQFVVKLTAPVSTATSKAGDQFTALVVLPTDYQGAIFEGTIKKVEPARDKRRPHSNIDFAFETLTIGDKTYKVQADITDYANSKGVAKVNEEGVLVAKGNSGAKKKGSLFGAMAGMAAGYALGGMSGLAVGAVAGGALGYGVAAEFGASSVNMEFYPGSQFTLQVTSQGIANGVDSAKVRELEAANEAAMAPTGAAPAGAPDAGIAPVAAPVAPDANAPTTDATGMTPAAAPAPVPPPQTPADIAPPPPPTDGAAAQSTDNSAPAAANSSAKKKMSY
jgi:hypothetical protein